MLTNPQTTTYIDAIKLGDDNDATSLKNMAYALNWIQTANDYRVKHGLKPYQVSDTLMAMAQANANWSKDHFAHSNQFATAENLAWGGGNPVDRWYSEKEIWDAEVKKNPELATLSPSQVYMKYPDLFMPVGHYLNIIDPNNTVMGVATNTDPNDIYGIVDAMDTQSWTSPTDQSVEDYKAAFNTYYNGLKNAPEAYKAALKKLDEAKANTAKASDAYTKAVEAAANAHAEAIAARDAYTKAQQEAEDAQAAYEALKKQVEGGNAEYTKRLEAAEAQVKADKSALDNANAALDAAKSAANNAATKHDADLKAVADAKLDVANAKARLDQAKSDADTSALKAELKAELKAAQDALDEAQFKLDDAKRASVTMPTRRVSRLTSSSKRLKAV